MMQNSIQNRVNELETALMEKASEASSCIAENLQEIGRLTKKAALQSFRTIRKDAQNYIEQGQSELKDAEKKFKKNIQQYPIRSIMIAAGIGLGLGLLTRK